MAIDTSKIQIKEAFKERYSRLTDWEEFKKSSFQRLKRCIRINTLKSNVAEIKRRMPDWGLKQIPWCKEGFWIEHSTGRRDIGNTLEHTLGYIYVQEAASMIPPLVLGAKPGEHVLDLCAAPGSKTSQIAQDMENKGILVANDYKGDRMASLGINIQRCGITNCVLTMMQGQRIKELEFDRILVDAPCSGTGTICKSLGTLRIWNANMIKRLSRIQKSLIEPAFKCLKKGGTMVYSTCTMEPEEDEEVIDYLLREFENAKLEAIELKGLNKSEPITEFDGKSYNPEVKKCLRIWPQDNETEGFFVAKIRKS